MREEREGERVAQVNGTSRHENVPERVVFRDGFANGRAELEWVP